MISVIVPVYNVEKYLRKCVESIQRQTYTDLEIILVDDGSPDRCGEICDELAAEDRRIKVIHQKNSRLAAARNSGLEYALNTSTVQKGHYITFVDSDDIIDSRMYETMIRIMESGQYDLVICGHQIVRENEDPKPCELGIDRKLNESELWDEVFGRLNNAVWNKLYKASLLKEIRFPVGVIHGEDLIFNIQYISRCRNAVLNDSKFYHYNKRSGSITTGKFTEAKLMEIVSKDEAKKLIEQYYPAQLDNAELFCFRARMNVLRAICKAGVQDSYRDEIAEYREYAEKNYKQVRTKLKRKESVEYVICKSFFPLYELMVRKIK